MPPLLETESLTRDGPYTSSAIAWWINDDTATAMLCMFKIAHNGNNANRWATAHHPAQPGIFAFHSIGYVSFC